MKVLKEITEWADNTPNHTYFLEKDRCIGYIKAGSSEKIMFKKPMRFDKKYRKFKEISG